MIVKIVEKPGSRHMGVDLTKRDYSYVLTCVSNNGNEDVQTILRAIGIRTGAPYINRSMIDAESGCVGVDVDRVDKKVWEATVRHSTEKPTPVNVAKKGKDPEKPLTWPVEIHWSGRMIETYPNFDATQPKGLPFVNSAGDTIRDRQPTELWHAIVTLSRMEATYNPVYAAKFAGKINSSNWFACPKYTAKCGWVGADLTYIEAIDKYFWKVTYPFEIAPEGWRPRRSQPNHPLLIADRGRRCKLSPSQGGSAAEPDKLYLTRDDNGVATGDEAFLDGAGYQLKVDLKNGRLPVMIEHEYYEQIDFNVLRLP